MFKPFPLDVIEGKQVVDINFLLIDKMFPSLMEPPWFSLIIQASAQWGFQRNCKSLRYDTIVYGLSWCVTCPLSKVRISESHHPDTRLCLIPGLSDMGSAPMGWPSWHSMTIHTYSPYHNDELVCYIKLNILLRGSAWVHWLNDCYGCSVYWFI